MSHPSSKPVSAFVFDAYGTLFDVHAAVRRYAGDLGPEAQRLSSVWRDKQLEYSWTRALMDRAMAAGRWVVMAAGRWADPGRWAASREARRQRRHLHRRTTRSSSSTSTRLLMADSSGLIGAPFELMRPRVRVICWMVATSSVSSR